MKNQIRTQIMDTIGKWSKSDIYAISLWVQDNEDNPCEPTFTLGYNTETNYRNQIPYASDEQEARWNFAFWLQNQELVFGIGDTQKDVLDWIREQGYTYYSYDEIFNTPAPDPDSYEGITDAFVELLVDVVKELHGSEFIVKQFGKEVPVIIHELEYYEKIAEQNIRANSLEVIGSGFLTFCRGE